MSYRGPESRWAILNGVDVMSVAGFLKEHDPPGLDQVVEETTGPNDQWPRRAATGVLESSDAKLVMYYETTAAAEALFETFRQQTVNSSGPAIYSYGSDGRAIGDECNFGECYNPSWKPTTPGREFTKAEATLRAANGFFCGVILAHLTARAGATWNTESTSVDNAASSANGGRGLLQVTSLTLDGYTSFTATVRHSTDNVTFANLGSFTTVTASPRGHVLSVTGTVNRYLAVAGAYVGAGTSPTVTCLVGFDRL